MSARYCPYCGSVLPPGAAFCPVCGANIAPPEAVPPVPYARPTQQPSPVAPSPPPSPTIMIDTKSPELAAILSLIIAGLGQIYVGRILRGLIIMFVLVPLLWGSIVLGAFMLIFAFCVARFIFSVVFALITFVVWIWQIIDAYELAKQYNSILMATGRPPW